MPQPFPHRVSFLASSLVVPVVLEPAILLPAKLLAALLFDHLVRHPVVSLSDFDDERLSDEGGRLLDARHAETEDLVDWHFRIGRRHDVCWFEIGLDPQRPRDTRLYARRPSNAIESWIAERDAPLSEQISSAIAQWLSTRRLPLVPALPQFSANDIVSASMMLDQAIAAQNSDAVTTLPEEKSPPRGLATAFYRVLGDLVPTAVPMWQRILAIDPTHPVARRAAYLAGLREDRADRRAILAVVEDAPMYGKPHMSIWGEAFAADRPVEGMGLRHQGIAATLLPTNPYACHNYSLQLADKGRREESYRWADRATVAAPSFASAHLDCVRRLRRCGRPGQAFSEAQYRCHEILEHWRNGALASHERSLRHHAELLLAFAHLDIGRLDEAIALAESALAGVPTELESEFEWARTRLDQWRDDPVLLANAFAWDGHHAGDPGRVLKGFSLGRITDEDDVGMLLDALIAIGREDLALVAYHHYAGVDGGNLLGDGKARLAAAKANLLCGDAALALDQIQIVELRRPQARLEAEINRVLRLASCRPAPEWDAVIRRRLTQGAERLARMAARDLADFVPGLSKMVVHAALGEQSPIVLDDSAIDQLIDATPEAVRWHAAIVDRLSRPPDDTLASADRLGQEWWSVLVPPAKDRDGHAASAMLALGVSLARYLELTTHAPTPIAGGYRHIATEALHLVRRARYQVTDRAIRGLFAVVERCRDAAESVRDTWLLRIERALDLDHEQGTYIDSLTAGAPSVASLLRGDERIGWELRFAFDLAQDHTQAEPASFMFERSMRATEGGSVPAAWARVIANALGARRKQPDDAAAARAVDVLWTTALAAQHWEPWAHLAVALFERGRKDEGFDAACRSLARAASQERAFAIERVRPVWAAAGVDVPIVPNAAAREGIAALAVPATLDRAIRCLRWAAAADPNHTDAVRGLATALARAGKVHDCVRALAANDRTDPARLAGHALLDAGRFGDAVLAYRYAALRFTSADDWRLLAVAAWHAADYEIAVHAYQRCMAAGGAIDSETLNGYVTALNAIGQWTEASAVADRLIDAADDDPLYRSAGLHALAVALAGQGKFSEASRYAREAVALNPAAQHTEEFAETLRCIEARQGPPVESGPESSVERRAFDALAAGDPYTPERLATDANSWGLARAALAAVELRRPEDVSLSVPGRALEAAVRTLDRTAGAINADAIVCRIRAQRIRENAFIQIDTPPPTGQRISSDEVEERHAERVERRSPTTPDNQALGS
jgi:tetratricopeptide (TPR) repeat protein